MSKPLLYMWKHPRMVAWFVFTVVITLLARLPFWFCKADIIPYYMPFEPASVLAPLTGVFWGPAGVWGSAVACLLGDLLFDTWGPLSYFRALGVLLFAASAKRLWDAFPYRIHTKKNHAPLWTPTLRFVIISLPGCFISVSWMAAGSEWLRLYPFTYYMTLQLAVHLIFVPLLGLSFYRLMAKEMAPYFGTWKDVMQVDAVKHPLTWLGVLFLTVGGIGACVSGLLMSGKAYDIWPFGSSHVLGTTTGERMIYAVAPFLVLQLIGFLLRQHRPVSELEGGKPVQLDLKMDPPAS